MNLYAIRIEDGGMYEHAVQGTGNALVVYSNKRDALEHCRMYESELGTLTPVLLAKALPVWKRKEIA